MTTEMDDYRTRFLHVPLTWTENSAKLGEFIEFRFTSQAKIDQDFESTMHRLCADTAAMAITIPDETAPIKRADGTTITAREMKADLLATLEKYAV